MEDITRIKVVIFILILFFIYWLLIGRNKQGSYYLYRFVEDKDTGKRSRKGEKRTREIIERITGRKFPSVRPNFLKNPKTGRNLELDMYNDSLKLAIEYNGFNKIVIFMTNNDLKNIHYMKDFI